MENYANEKCHRKCHRKSLRNVIDNFIAINGDMQAMLEGEGNTYPSTYSNKPKSSLDIFPITALAYIHF